MQMISSLPGGKGEESHCSGIQITPDGRHLYGANRGHDSLAMYAVDQSTGKLSLIGHQSALGRTPRDLTIDPSGRLLVVPNQNSDLLAVFRIDSETGKLIDTGQRAEIGIPVVTISSSVTSPYAINVDSNYARWGFDMASAIVKSLAGKGNVLMVEGIAGAPIVALERAGAEKAFKGTDIKEARSVNGNWTANVTKTVVLQALATTPQKIDAVWTTGSESRVVAEAFAEAKRPQPLITGSISGDALGYWNAHPDGYRFDGQAVLPGWNSQALFRVAVRLLEGQQPKLGTLLIPIPAVHQDDLGKWYKACMTPDAVSVFPSPPADPVSEQDLNAYFRKPAPIPNYNYADVPDPCAAK